MPCTQKKKKKEDAMDAICSIANTRGYALTSIGRGAPKVANPAFPGAKVTLPGSDTPWIPHRPAYIRAPYSSRGLTAG